MDLHYIQRDNEKFVKIKEHILLWQDSPNKSEETEVKTAVARLTDEENLIGDGSQECALPTFKGSHSDLKTVTGDSVGPP